MTRKRRGNGRALTAAEWNRRHPVGTRVKVETRPGVILETVTRSEAWEIADGTPVVMIEGRTGGFDLESIEVVE